MKKEKDNPNVEEEIKDTKEIEENVRDESYYSKENLYYEREKRKNTLLLIIIFILLIYVWFCFTYHWGYIWKSGEQKNQENSVQTSGDLNYTDNTNTNSNSSDTSEKRNDYGPYALTTQDVDTFKKEEKDSSADVNTANNIVNENTTESPDSPVTAEDIEKIKLIQVEDNKDFDQLKNIDIFKNLYYAQTDLIYPGVAGTYEFNVENYSTKNITYKLSFAVENPRNANMMYKLERNGQYIVGNNDTYVSAEELDTEGLDLKTMMGDTYILHWKWVDTDNDTAASQKDVRGDYSLTITGEV